MSTGERVLVTGAASYLGSAVTLDLIEHGYTVRGTTRFQANADAFNKKYPSIANKIEWVITPDVTQPDAFNAVAQGADYVIHVASPFHYQPQDNVRDILAPSLEGTKNVLSAALKAKSVKRVVITSSFTAVMDIPLRQGHVYNSADWSPATWEDTVASKSGHVVYCASKKFAEQAAWEFMETHKPHFSLTTFCPPLIYGPPAQAFASMEELNQSVLELWHLISGQLMEIPDTPFPVFTDVRDVARLHVAALSNQKAPNQRYVIVGGYFTNSQIARIAASRFPSQAQRIPPSDNEPPPDYYKADSTPAERDFGMQWIGLEQCIRDMAKELYDTESSLLGSR